MRTRDPSGGQLAVKVKPLIVVKEAILAMHVTLPVSLLASVGTLVIRLKMLSSAAWRLPFTAVNDT